MRSSRRVSEANRGPHRVHRIKQGLFIFLEIPVVSQGQPFYGHEEAHQAPHHPAAFPPDEFRHIGVFLLGHDGGTGGVGVGEGHEAELGAGPEDELFCQAAQVHHYDGGVGQKL